ncbi:MAG: RnfABCDGE type electron transport complex subunit D [Lachnospiraceae bacterium]|nr:RnfABCDGE type electron transport complex subunit D [Lachnospiraceae bacterium]
MDDFKLKVSASPHVRSKDNTSDIMFDVIIALVPATIFGIWQFGSHAAILVAACMISAVLFEALYQYGMKKKITVSDCSAALTGLLLALNLPPTLPVWMAVVGSAFAIIIVKQLFGGLGQNFMNPALAARCFLVLTFGRFMTNFVIDGVTAATPLARLKMGLPIDLGNMFFGNIAGTIGETSAIALLIGAAYLLIKRIIAPTIPLIYIGTFAICIVIYAITQDFEVLDYTLAHLCGGGLMLGAWFMATDYVTSPITTKGKVVFGIILGLLTFVLRIFGSTPEGVSYAIIFSNLLVPLIEKATVPKAFGQGADIKKEDKKSKKDKVDEEDSKSDDREDKNILPDYTKETKKDKESKTKSKMDLKSIVKAIAAIFVITLIMGAALGVVYNITKDPIAETKEKAKQEAYETVFPSADRVVVEELDYASINELFHQFTSDDITMDELGIAVDSSNNALGYVITVTNSAGYNGDIQMMVGIDFSGVIQGISFLTLNETVGFGMEAENEKFLNQFIGKKVELFSYTKTGSNSPSEIDAISGATITTSAVVDSVNAVLIFVILLGGGF